MSYTFYDSERLFKANFMTQPYALGMSTVPRIGVYLSTQVSSL